MLIGYALSVVGPWDINLVRPFVEQKNIDDLLIQVNSLDDLILLHQAGLKDQNKERDTEDLNPLKNLRSRLNGPNK